MLIALLIGGHLWAAGSLEELDRRHGFRGIEFGTPISCSLFDGSMFVQGAPEGSDFKTRLSADLIQSATDALFSARGSEVELERPDEDLLVGDVKLEAIRWGFYAGKLSSVTIDCGTGDYLGLVDALTVLFGKPKRIGDGDFSYAWTGKKVELLADLTRDSGGYAHFSPKGMFKREESDSETERKRKAKAAASQL